jgi:hypothetical protein
LVDGSDFEGGCSDIIDLEIASLFHEKDDKSFQRVDIGQWADVRPFCIVAARCHACSAAFREAKVWQWGAAQADIRGFIERGES